MRSRSVCVLCTHYEAFPEENARVRPVIRNSRSTAYEDGATIFRALKAGAGGYLVKRDASALLLEAIAEILAGGAPMSCQIARKVVHYFHQRAPAPETEKLSKREMQILDLLVEGWILKEVADQLGIGRETVRTHVSHIYEKLHARSAAEAVAKYLSR